MTKKKDPCLTCGCWDSDAEGCTMPHYDKWYACPIESEKPENQKALEEMAHDYTITNSLKLQERIKDND